MEETFRDLHSFFCDAVTMLVEEEVTAVAVEVPEESVVGKTLVVVVTGGTLDVSAVFFPLLVGGLRFLLRCDRNLVTGMLPQDIPFLLKVAIAGEQSGLFRQRNLPEAAVGIQLADDSGSR